MPDTYIKVFFFAPAKKKTVGFALVDILIFQIALVWAVFIYFFVL